MDQKGRKENEKGREGRSRASSRPLGTAGIEIN
jgi:hypothetical protein